MLVIPTRAIRRHKHSQASLLSRVVTYVMASIVPSTTQTGKLNALIGETEGYDSEGPGRVNPLQQLEDITTEKRTRCGGVRL